MTTLVKKTEVIKWFAIKNIDESKLIEYITSKIHDINVLDSNKYYQYSQFFREKLAVGITCNYEKDHKIVIIYHNKKYIVCFKPKKDFTIDVYKCYYKFTNEFDNYQRIFYFTDNTIINTINIDGETWFDLVQISSYLGYSTPDYLIRYYRRDIELKLSKYTNSDGLREVLNRGRKPGCKRLMEQLGLNTNNKIQRKEATVLEQIIDFLSEEKIEYKLQYSTGSYLIDMYLPKYKIAIEVDEMGHVNRDKVYEENRHNYIVDNLTNKILRINPDEQNFRMAKYLAKLGIMMAKH